MYDYFTCIMLSFINVAPIGQKSESITDTSLPYKKVCEVGWLSVIYISY